MQTRFRVAVGALGLSLAFTGLARAEGLGGSLASMRRQHDFAFRSHFTFLATDAQLFAFVRDHRLEFVQPNIDLTLHDVSYPFARPAVVDFVQRLAVDFRAATGMPLVVTSLTRPLSNQPRNAHKLSVHPTGMAVDLRAPVDAADRQWLERTLLALEVKGVLDVTRERKPAHYHVAVFPEKYATYAAAFPPIVHEVVAVIPAPAALPAAFAARDMADVNPVADALPLFLVAFVVLGFGLAMRLQPGSA